MFPPFCGGADRPKPPKPPPACWRLPPPNNPSNISPKYATSPLNSWEAPPGPQERKPHSRPPPKPNGDVGFPSTSILHRATCAPLYLSLGSTSACSNCSNFSAALGLSVFRLGRYYVAK